MVNGIAEAVPHNGLHAARKHLSILSTSKAMVGVRAASSLADLLDS